VEGDPVLQKQQREVAAVTVFAADSGGGVWQLALGELTNATVPLAIAGQGATHGVLALTLIAETTRVRALAGCQHAWVCQHVQHVAATAISLVSVSLQTDHMLAAFCCFM
jgi:hypothetical protein